MKQLDYAGYILWTFLSNEVDNDFNKLFIALILDKNFFIDEKFILLFGWYLVCHNVAHVL